MDKCEIEHTLDGSHSLSCPELLPGPIAEDMKNIPAPSIPEVIAVPNLPGEPSGDQLVRP